MIRTTQLPNEACLHVIQPICSIQRTPPILIYRQLHLNMNFLTWKKISLPQKDILKKYPPFEDVLPFCLYCWELYNKVVTWGSIIKLPFILYPTSILASIFKSNINHAFYTTPWKNISYSSNMKLLLNLITNCNYFLLPTFNLMHPARDLLQV